VVLRDEGLFRGTPFLIFNSIGFLCRLKTDNIIV